jgi:acetate kinase
LAGNRFVPAIDLFVYRIGRSIGSLAADGRAGYFGFHSRNRRERSEDSPACLPGSSWASAPTRNERGEMNIGSAGSGVDVLMIPADEEHAVAEGALACLETAETAPRSHA